MPDKIVEDVSKESSKDSRKKQRKRKPRLLKLKPKLLMLKLLEMTRKKMSTIKKLLRTGLGSVQIVTSSTTTNPEEEALKVKVLLLPSFLLVRNVLMRLSKPEP